ILFAITRRFHHSIPVLDLIRKTALPRLFTFLRRARLGTQRHQRNQNHHRFDEEERPFGVGDRKGGIPPEASTRAFSSDKCDCNTSPRGPDQNDGDCSWSSYPSLTRNDREHSIERNRFSDGGHILSVSIAGCSPFC